MELASLLHQYQPELEAKLADRLLPGHRRAMDALQRCRRLVKKLIRIAISTSYHLLSVSQCL